MSENTPESCENCFYPFHRYATTCPACHFVRWMRYYEFIQPDPKTGKFRENHRESVPSSGLTVIPADMLAPEVRAKHWPEGRGLVLLVKSTGPDGSWESIEKPRGDHLVKPIGYVWVRTSSQEEHPDDNFPPLAIKSSSRVRDEAMDKYFHGELSKPKHVSGTHQQILDRAKKQYPDWPWPGSPNGMVKRVKARIRDGEFSEIPPRKQGANKD